MKPLKLATLAFALTLPTVTFGAGQWSSCQTVTAVTNYIAYGTPPSVHAVLSPGVSGCNGDAPGSVSFAVGYAGVTLDSLKTLLASLMSAQMSGTRVMIFYDPAISCASSVVSVGGYAAQCL